MLDLKNDCFETLKIKREAILIFGDILANHNGDCYKTVLQLFSIREVKLKKNDWLDSQECAFVTFVRQYPEVKDLFKQIIEKKLVSAPISGEYFSDYAGFLNHMKQ